jgi:putative PEP-CTERM system histidine kinase
MLIGLLGYGLAAVAFGVLALLMLTSWRGRLQGGLLVVASALTAAWAVAAALAPFVDAASASLHWQVLVLLEIARNAAWLVFLARLTPAGQGLDGRSRQLAALAPAAVVLLYGTWELLSAGDLAVSGAPIDTLIHMGLVTAIAGLVLLEQAFRAMRAEPRRRILPLIVALGAILAYDLFLYSHGLLFRGLHTELWSARGYANLLAVPLLLLAARRNPDWSVDVFVSRHVAFYTASLMGVGAYLVLMSVAGYGLRLAGGEWGFVLQVVFFFGALVVLAWVLFSPGARAALRVFLAKHFYSNKYDYREEWLKLTQRIAEGHDGEPLPARGLSAMAELVGAEAAAMWDSTGLNADNEAAPGYRRGALLGELGALPAMLEPGDPLVQFLEARRWTVNVGEALRDPESHPGLVLPAWTEALGSDALVVPLLNSNRLWGLVALLRPSRVGRLSYEDIDLLRVAGMQVAALLAQAEANRLLTESRQFEAFNRFAAFIMHDLKNVIAQQSLVVRNATRYRDDPAFIDDALDTVANSVERMQRLLEQLKRGQGETQVERVDLARLVAETVSRYADREPRPGAELRVQDLRLRIDRERFAAVLGHLLDNALDATPADGRVWIETLLEDDGTLVLAVEDTGAGMEEEFVSERLFRPFDSTKGSKGMGIGAYQARQFVRLAGGDVQVTSAPGQGTRFELRFPAAVVEPGEHASPEETLTGV